MTNDGLDAAGFLLLAEGHLRKAEEKLRDIPQTKRRGRALTEVQYATGRVGVALAMLNQEKKRLS